MLFVGMGRDGEGDGFDQTFGAQKFGIWLWIFAKHAKTLRTCTLDAKHASKQRNVIATRKREPPLPAIDCKLRNLSLKCWIGAEPSKS